MPLLRRPRNGGWKQAYYDASGCPARAALALGSRSQGLGSSADGSLGGAQGVAKNTPLAVLLDGVAQFPSLAEAYLAALERLPQLVETRG